MTISTVTKKNVCASETSWNLQLWFSVSNKAWTLTAEPLTVRSYCKDSVYCVTNCLCGHFFLLWHLITIRSFWTFNNKLIYLEDVQGQGGCVHLWTQGGLRLQELQSMPEDQSRLNLGTGLMGAVSRGCQGHDETGVGAAAAVATGKGRSGGGRHGKVGKSDKEGGWLEKTKYRSTLKWAATT